MKTMTCKQLGGACDAKFQGDTFEEIVKQSKEHGERKYKEGDEAHIKVMEQMKKQMQNPEEMKKFIEQKQKEFNELSHDE